MCSGVTHAPIGLTYVLHIFYGSLLVNMHEQTVFDDYLRYQTSLASEIDRKWQDITRVIDNLEPQVLYLSEPRANKDLEEPAPQL